MKRLLLVPVLCLSLAACDKYTGAVDKLTAGVKATDNALAALAANDIPAACGIIAVAEGYFAQLRGGISASNIAIEAKAEKAVAAICDNPPTNVAQAFGTLLKLWLTIQTATKTV